MVTGLSGDKEFVGLEVRRCVVVWWFSQRHVIARIHPSTQSQSLMSFVFCFVLFFPPYFILLSLGTFLVSGF